jgi:addiction module HigA family antidote
MHNPPHPGSILKHDILPARNLSVTEAAIQLSISRVSLSRILNGHSGITPDMAIRLEQWAEPTAESWLAMQTAHDLWQARQAMDGIQQPQHSLTRPCRWQHNGSKLDPGYDTQCGGEFETQAVNFPYCPRCGGKITRQETR